ncbi:UNVERIFIED_CONTAM: hypothetical protein FKN15_069758 [Acipenser sinensis]
MDRDSSSAKNKLVNKTKTVNGQDCNEKTPDCDREMLTISIKCKQTEDVSSKYPEGIPMFLCSKCGFYSEDMEHTDMHPVCHVDNSLANMENQVDKKKPHYCEEHFEKQTKSEKYQCDKCRFFSRDITQFKKHVLQHDEIKFTCSYCNHISYTKGESQRHLVQHTGKFPYRCEFCDYGAVRNDYIVKHTQRVHCKRKECTDDSAVKNTDGSPVKRAILEAKSISQQESWTGNNTFSSPTDKTCIYNTEVNATAVVQDTTMDAAENVVSPNTDKQICNSTGVCSSKVQVELLTPLNGPMQPGTALTTVAPSQFVVPPGCFAQVLEVKTENGTQQLVLKLIPQDASGVEVLENTTACSSEIYGKQQELSEHGLSPFAQSKTVVGSKIRNSISDEFETTQSHQENMCFSLSENAGSSGFINAADLVNREQLFLPPTKGSDVFQVAASPGPINIHSAGTLHCPSKADLCVERNAPQKECIPLNAPLFKNGINEKPEEDCADESFETVNWPIISSVFSLCCETEDFLGGIRWDGNLESICDGRGTNDSVILASAEKHNEFDVDKTVIPEQKEKGDCSATVNIEVKATKIAGSAKSNAGSPNGPTISSYTEAKPTEETPVTSTVPAKNASQSLHPMSYDISVHSPEASTTEFSKPQKLTPTELIPNNESEAAQIRQALVAYSNSTESKIVDNISGNVPVLGNQANIFGGDINSLVIQKEENSSTENHTNKQHLTGLQSTSIAGYCDGSSKIGVQYENKAHEKLLPCAKNDTSKQLSIDTGLAVPQQLILSTSPDMVALNCGIDRSTINAEKVYNRRRKLRSFLESPPVFIPQGTVLKVLNSNEQLQSETAVIIRWDGNLESICDGRGTNDSVILASAEKHNEFDVDKTVIPEQKEKGDCSATVNIEVKATKIAGSAKSNAGSPNGPTISSYTEAKPTEETPVTCTVPAKNASQSLHPMSYDISVHSPEASTTEFSEPQKLTPTELIPNNESEAAQIRQALVAYSNSTESKIVDNISGNVPVLGNQANIFGGDINSLVIQKEENSSTENHTNKQHLTGLQSTSIAGYCDGSSKIGVQYENKAHEKLLPCAKNDTSKQLSIDTGLDVPQQLILSTSPDMVALNCGVDRSTINAEKVYNRRRKLRSFLESPPVFIPQGTVLKVLNSNEQLQSETAVIKTRKVFENSELLLTPRPVPFSSLEIRNIVLSPENQETNMCAEHWSKKKISTTSMKRKRAQEDNENIEERLEVAKRLTLTLTCKNGPWHKARKHKKKKRKTDGTDPKCNTFYALKKATRLRLIPLRNDQLIKCPLRNQPVIVLNHPEVDTTEVTNIMHTINKYKGNVLKVALSERTKVSLHLKKQIMKQSEAQCQLTGPVEERNLLKMKIKKIQDNYQVVGIVPGLSHP